MDACKQAYMCACVQTIIIMCGCMHAHVPCVVCFVCVGVTVCLHSSVHVDVLILNRIAPCQHNRSGSSDVKSLLQRERGKLPAASWWWGGWGGWGRDDEKQ